MRQFKIYAILAADGIMLHPRYDRAIYCRDHFFRSPCTIYKFDSLQEATEAAIDHLWSIAPLDRKIPTSIEVDKFYHVYKLKRINGEERYGKENQN